MRALGEVEMQEFVKEWCEDVKTLQHVDMERTWTKYKIRAVEAQEAKIGRKKVRARKCQGKWYEVFNPEVQNLKKEARRVLQALKRQRKHGKDVSSLSAQYSKIRKAAKCRLKAVIKTRAVAMVKEVERLKETVAKAGWKALKNIMGWQAANTATLDKVLDANGVECSGKAARDAVRDA